MYGGDKIHVRSTVPELELGARSSETWVTAANQVALDNGFSGSRRWQ